MASVIMFNFLKNYSHDIMFYSISLMMMTATCTWIACTFITAPYGRYSASKGWGPLVNAKFAWIFMESPCLWISAIIVLIKYQNNDLSYSPARFILIGCFLLHYFNRAILYPLKMKNSNPMPFSVMFLAFCFCFWNGFTQSVSLLFVNEYPDSWVYDWRFIFGISLFLTGMFINIQSDNILLNLQKKSENGKKVYSIPYGGMYNFISCPNYFGEIIEWIGFAIACNSSAAAAFAYFTLTNIGPRAFKHHQWYFEKFDNYPKNRKALIPFLL